MPSFPKGCPKKTNWPGGAAGFPHPSLPHVLPEPQGTAVLMTVWGGHRSEGTPPTRTSRCTAAPPHPPPCLLAQPLDSVSSVSSDRPVVAPRGWSWTSFPSRLPVVDPSPLSRFLTLRHCQRRLGAGLTWPHSRAPTPRCCGLPTGHQLDMQGAGPGTPAGHLELPPPDSHIGAYSCRWHPL